MINSPSCSYLDFQLLFQQLSDTSVLVQHYFKNSFPCVAPYFSFLPCLYMDKKHLGFFIRSSFPESFPRFLSAFPSASLTLLQSLFISNTLNVEPEGLKSPERSRSSFSCPKAGPLHHDFKPALRHAQVHRLSYLLKVSIPLSFPSKQFLLFNFNVSYLNLSWLLLVFFTNNINNRLFPFSLQEPSAILSNYGAATQLPLPLAS